MRERGQTILQSLLTLAFVALFLAAIFIASDYGRGTNLLPTYASGLGVVALVASSSRDVVAWQRARSGAGGASAASPQESADTQDKKSAEMPFATTMKRGCYYFAWIILYVALIYIVGMLVASGVFLYSFLIVESRRIREPLTPLLLIAPVIALGVMVGLATILNLHWPTSLLGW